MGAGMTSSEMRRATLPHRASCKRTGLYPHLHPPAVLLFFLIPPPSSELLQNAINNECKHSAQLSLADIPRSNVSPVCAVIDVCAVH